MATEMATPKLPAVLQHYHVSSLPDGDLTVKCKYYVKEITGSVKAATNWWKHLVSSYFCYIYT